MAAEHWCPFHCRLAGPSHPCFTVYDWLPNRARRQNTPPAATSAPVSDEPTQPRPTGPRSADRRTDRREA